MNAARAAFSSTTQATKPLSLVQISRSARRDQRTHAMHGHDSSDGDRDHSSLRVAQRRSRMQ